jgi:ribosomal protein S4E
VLSGRGLRDGLITRPEESYRLWRDVVCDQETSKTRRLKPVRGLCKIQPKRVVTPRKQQQTSVDGAMPLLPYKQSWHEQLQLSLNINNKIIYEYIYLSQTDIARTTPQTNLVSADTSSAPLL